MQLKNSRMLILVFSGCGKFQNNTRFGNNKTGSSFDMGLDECCEACAAKPDCLAFSYHWETIFFFFGGHECLHFTDRIKSEPAPDWFSGIIDSNAKSQIPYFLQ